MDAVILRILIIILLAIMLLPALMAVSCIIISVRKKSLSASITAILIISAFFCEVSVYAGMYVLFHDLNIFKPISELLSFEESYRGLFKITFLAIAASFEAFVIYKISEKKWNVFSGKTYHIMLLYIICSLFIVTGLYESLCSDTHFKISQVQRGINRHAVKVCGPVFDLSGDSNNVNVVVIKNEGLLANNISGLSLTDSESGDRVLLNDEKLYPSEGYTCVFGDEVPLKVNKSGEIFLLDSEGHTLDSLYYEEDDTSDNIKISSPDFSMEGGFYDDDIMLTLSCSDTDTEIYYTLDGSVPTESSLKYDGAISIVKKEPGKNILDGKNITPDYLENPVELPESDKATVVRAVSISSDGHASDIVTKTYFIGLDEYKDHNVVSLVLDPEDLFGDYGIYVTGKKYDDWYKEAFSRTSYGEAVEKINAPTPDFSQRIVGYEREANLEIYEQNNLILNQEAGVKIQGASTRGDVYKRFSIYSRKIYSGSKWFESLLFDDQKTHSFVIRHNFDNAFTQELVRNRDIATQDSTPVYVFLNGDFWYDTYIQEKYSEEMISQKYGISEDNVELLKVGYIENLTDDELAIYNDCIGHYINDADLSDPEVYNEFCEAVDVQSYIDFICTNIYLANEDYDDGKNFILFRASEKENDGFGDGKLRWGLYDMDLLRNSIRFDKGYETTAMIDTFRDTPPLAGEAYINKPLLKALLKNDDFRDQFRNTFVQMANDEFSVDNVQKLMSAWGTAETVESYDEGFFINRGEYILKYLDEILED